MSVAGLKKQFYKASQVSGGRAPGPGLLGMRGQARPGSGSGGGRGHQGGSVGACSSQGGESPGRPGASCEVAQVLPALWAPVSLRRVARPLGGAERPPEVDLGCGSHPPSSPRKGQGPGKDKGKKQDSCQGEETFVSRSFL